MDGKPNKIILYASSPRHPFRTTRAFAFILGIHPMNLKSSDESRF